MIYLENVTKSFGNRELLKINKLEISDGEKVGIVGKNGAGKTSLINRILSNDENVRISGQAKIGYFSQDLSILDNEATVFQNVMNDSVQSEVTVRNILANLNIKGNDVYKKSRSFKRRRKSEGIYCKTTCIRLQCINLR